TITLPTGPLAATTTFNILASTGGACPAVELNNTATVNVSGSIDASLPIAAVDDPICDGASTFIRITNAEAGVDYQLRDDLDDSVIGPPVPGTGADLDLSTG